MNSYKSRPARGTGRHIWDALVANNLAVLELHYNPNCWGQCPEDGWGTWVCTLAGLGDELSDERDSWWRFCGVHEGRAYIQQPVAPYSVAWLE